MEQQLQLKECNGKTNYSLILNLFFHKDQCHIKRNNGKLINKK